MSWLIAHLEHFTYVGIALTLFVAGLGVPIPEDIPLIFGGAMAGMGKINVWIHLAISMAFILIGDSCLFFIGRRIGRSSQGGMGRWSRLITPERREKVVNYFDRYGSWTVFFGRFVAGIRAAVYLTAGAAGFPFWRFLLLDALAAAVSVPVWIWLGYTFGENWEVILEQAKAVQGWALGGLLVIAAAVIGARLYFKARRASQQAQARSGQQQQ